MRRKPRTTPTTSAAAPPGSSSCRGSSGALASRLLVLRCRLAEQMAVLSGYRGPELNELADARRDLERLLAVEASGILA